MCQRRWASQKVGNIYHKIKIKIVVAEEIGEGNEIILIKIGYGNELRKLTWSATWKLI